MSENKLSAVEAELYDRQIRLWGIESQEKLRNANVLIIGAKGLGSEIAKNVLLSGVNSVTILDDSTVSEDDIQHNFLLSSASKIGGKIAEEILIKAQALNPLVKLVADTDSVGKKQAKFFEGFTIVVASGLRFDAIIKIDNICRNSKVKFIYGEVIGMFGFCISDLQEHDYFEDRVQLQKGTKRGHDGEKKTVKVQGKIAYPSLNKVIILPNTKQDLSAINKKSKPNMLFVAMLTLIEFRKRFDRLPDWARQKHDVKEMEKIIEELKELYQIKSSMSFDGVLGLLFGEVGPVCAILGGVVAQEVIKAVSHKEVTINNVFLFDPVSYSGKEFCFGV